MELEPRRASVRSVKLQLRSRFNPGYGLRFHCEQRRPVEAGRRVHCQVRRHVTTFTFCRNDRLREVSWPISDGRQCVKSDAANLSQAVIRQKVNCRHVGAEPGQCTAALPHRAPLFAMKT